MSDENMEEIHELDNAKVPVLVQIHTTKKRTLSFGSTASDNNDGNDKDNDGSKGKYNEDEPYTLKRGENWLSLFCSNPNAARSVLDETQDETLSVAIPKYTLVPATDLKLEKLEKLPNKSTFVTVDFDASPSSSDDGLRRGHVAIKDLRLPINNSTNEVVDDDDDFQLCLARFTKPKDDNPNDQNTNDTKQQNKEEMGGIPVWSGYEKLEVLPRRQLRILQPGDRLCTKAPSLSGSQDDEDGFWGVGLVLEYRLQLPPSQPASESNSPFVDAATQDEKCSKLLQQSQATLTGTQQTNDGEEGSADDDDDDDDDESIDDLAATQALPPIKLRNSSSSDGEEEGLTQASMMKNQPNLAQTQGSTGENNNNAAEAEEMPLATQPSADEQDKKNIEADDDSCTTLGEGKENETEVDETNKESTTKDVSNPPSQKKSQPVEEVILKQGDSDDQSSGAAQLSNAAKAPPQGTEEGETAQAIEEASSKADQKSKAKATSVDSEVEPNDKKAGGGADDDDDATVSTLDQEEDDIDKSDLPKKVAKEAEATKETTKEPPKDDPAKADDDDDATVLSESMLSQPNDKDNKLDKEQSTEPAQEQPTPLEGDDKNATKNDDATTGDKDATAAGTDDGGTADKHTENGEESLGPAPKADEVLKTDPTTKDSSPINDATEVDVSDDKQSKENGKKSHSEGDGTAKEAAGPSSEVDEATKGGKTESKEDEATKGGKTESEEKEETKEVTPARTSPTSSKQNSPDTFEPTKGRRTRKTYGTRGRRSPGSPQKSFSSQNDAESTTARRSKRKRGEKDDGDLEDAEEMQKESISEEEAIEKNAASETDAPSTPTKATKPAGTSSPQVGDELVEEQKAGKRGRKGAKSQKLEEKGGTDDAPLGELEANKSKQAKKGSKKQTTSKKSASTVAKVTLGKKASEDASEDPVGSQDFEEVIKEKATKGSSPEKVSSPQSAASDPTAKGRQSRRGLKRDQKQDAHPKSLEIEAPTKSSQEVEKPVEAEEAKENDAVPPPESKKPAKSTGKQKPGEADDQESDVAPGDTETTAKKSTRKSQSAKAEGKVEAPAKTPAKKSTRRKQFTKATDDREEDDAVPPDTKTPAKSTRKRRATKKEQHADDESEQPGKADDEKDDVVPAETKTTAKKGTRKRKKEEDSEQDNDSVLQEAKTPAKSSRKRKATKTSDSEQDNASVVPDDAKTPATSTKTPAKSSRKRKTKVEEEQQGDKSQQTIRIVTTGVKISGAQLTAIKGLGGEVIDDVMDAPSATHIIAGDKKTTMRRTPKLMIGLCNTGNIIGLEWLTQSLKEKRWLPSKDFLLTGDTVAEKKYDFKMQTTLNRAAELRSKNSRVFAGWNIHVCRGVADGKKAPPTKEFQLIVEQAGGTWLPTLSQKAVGDIELSSLLVITSDPEQKKQTSTKPIMFAIESGGAKKQTSTWLFQCIMKQEVCFN